MADYGYYGSAPKKERRSGGLFGRLFDLVILIVTWLAGLSLLLSLLSQVVNPNSVAWLSFFGLVYPIIYLVCLGCALYWVVRWRRHFFFALLMLVIGLGGAKRFFDPQVRRTYEGSATEEIIPDLKVMTYNVLSFSKEFDNTVATTAELVARLADSLRIDILCMQEFQNNATNLATFADEAPRLEYSVFHNMDKKLGDRNGQGIVIMSAYPIVRHDIVDCDSTFMRSLWADIRVGTDTVRVVANHLQSTSITKEDRAHTLTPQIVTDTMREERLVELAGRLAKNYAVRANQADSLAQFVANSPYPTIVCGDFNDTPISYVYHRVAKDLTDSFVMRRGGRNATFDGFLNIFRIDYVLVKEQGGTTTKKDKRDADEIGRLAPRTYLSPDVNYSDHYPVIVGLDIVRPVEE